MTPFGKKRGKRKSSDKGVKEYSLILHNDNSNTFDHVIETLQNICHHEALQAEQCALLTHTKGFCEIKQGNFSDLFELKELLNTKMLIVTID